MILMPNLIPAMQCHVYMEEYVRQSLERLDASATPVGKELTVVFLSVVKIGVSMVGAVLHRKTHLFSLCANVLRVLLVYGVRHHKI